MITDQIAEAFGGYIAATKSKPSRSYLGIKQRLELEQFVDAHPLKVYVARDRVMGMRVYNVNEKSHMYVAGDLG